MNRLKTLGLWLDGLDWYVVVSLVLFVAAVTIALLAPALLLLVLVLALGSLVSAVLSK